MMSKKVIGLLFKNRSFHGVNKKNIKIARLNYMYYFFVFYFQMASKLVLVVTFLVVLININMKGKY